MENGPPAIGFEDGTMDVERLLVEPQDGHISMDSVICFNEKIQENAMDMEEVPFNFGVSNTGISQERQDILKGDVLDSMHSEVEVGYFRLQNDFCSLGEEYLLGVEFAESITNLDYGSSEGLQMSVSDSPILASSSAADAPCKTDPFGITGVSKCQSDHPNGDGSEFGDISNFCRESETLAEEKPLKSPTSYTLQDIGKFHDISSCSFQDILSDENDTSLSPAVEMCCSKNEKNDEFGLTGQNIGTNRLPKRDESDISFYPADEMLHSPTNEKNVEFGLRCQNSGTDRLREQDTFATMTAHTNCSDTFPMQKRSRKPTQRYIDELADPISRHSKKRREISSSTPKDKSLGVKDHKKCHMVSRAMRLPAEESSVKAIQVPFGSLVRKECPGSPAYEMVRNSDSGNLMNESKDNLLNPETDMKRDKRIRSVRLKKMDGSVQTASLKKREDNVTTPYLKRRVSYVTAPRSKRGDYHHRAPSQKKRDDCILAVSPNEGDKCLTALHQRERDEVVTEESFEEVSGRRKHHRLWTIAEVRKLTDGVAKYGVGRWSRIKKLFFSASAHRTSVDLKDKWRNLLKASGIQGQGNQQAMQGEKKRNLAWRPLPKSILRRVCELASMHPYPKGPKPKITHLHRDSPDRNTDITLSDYRRILRSING